MSLPAGPCSRQLSRFCSPSSRSARCWAHGTAIHYGAARHHASGSISRSKSKNATARLAATQSRSARWPMRLPSLLGRSRNGGLFAPRLASFLRCETMNCRGHAGATSKRIFQVYRPAMFFQKIPKSLVGELLQVLQRVLVLVFELLRLEVSGLGLHDMDREIDHVLRNLLVLDRVEIFLFVAHFIRIAQCHA